MKGITCCGDCVYYNIKKHKCIRCENVEPEDAREHFYADCPLPDAEPVRHGEWIKTFRYIGENVNTGEPEEIYAHDCSICGWHTGNQGKHFNYCPNCGCRMDGD